MSAIGSSEERKETENVRDRALMAKIANGDTEALERLFKFYNQRIYRSCLHLCRNAEDAVDATQESFVRVFSRLKRGETEIASFRDYLFMASHNICMQMISQKKRAFLSDDLSYAVERGHIDANEDPERSALITDQREIVRKASAELPRRQLNALKLHEIGGLEYVEIGRAMGLQKNAVAQLILRARQRLKSEMKIVGAAESISSEICSKATLMLPSLTSGSLTERESAWLERHLEACKACRANLDVMEEVGASYRSIDVPTALLFERIFNDRALAGTLSRSAMSRGAQVKASSVISGRKLAACLLAVTGLLAAATATVDLTSEKGPVKPGPGTGKNEGQNVLELISPETAVTAGLHDVLESGKPSYILSPGSDHGSGGLMVFGQAVGKNLSWPSPLLTLFNDDIFDGTQALAAPARSPTAQVSSASGKRTAEGKELIPYSGGQGKHVGPIKLHSYMKVSKLPGTKSVGKQAVYKRVLTLKTKDQKYVISKEDDGGGVLLTNSKPSQTAGGGTSVEKIVSEEGSAPEAKPSDGTDDKEQSEKKEAEKSSKEKPAEEKKGKAGGDKDGVSSK